jgi:hypothetical protein
MNGIHDAKEGGKEFIARARESADVLAGLLGLVSPS